MMCKTTNQVGSYQSMQIIPKCTICFFVGIDECIMCLIRMHTSGRGGMFAQTIVSLYDTDILSIYVQYHTKL